MELQVASAAGLEGPHGRKRKLADITSHPSRSSETHNTYCQRPDLSHRHKRHDSHDFAKAGKHVDLSYQHHLPSAHFTDASPWTNATQLLVRDDLGSDSAEFLYSYGSSGSISPASMLSQPNEPARTQRKADHAQTFPRYNHNPPFTNSQLGSISETQHGFGNEFALLLDAAGCPNPGPVCADPHCDDGIPCNAPSPLCDTACADVLCNDTTCAPGTYYDCTATNQCSQYDIPEVCFDPNCAMPPCEDDSHLNKRSDWLDDIDAAGFANMFTTCSHPPGCGCIDPRHTLLNCNHDPIPDPYEHVLYHRNHGFPSSLNTLVQPDSSSQRAPPYSTRFSHSHTPNHGTRTFSPSVAPTKTFHICRWESGIDDRGLMQMCGSSFSSEEELQKHIDKCHINLTEKEDNGFMCRWVGCTRDEAGCFSSRPKLRRHVLTHTDFKPFVCNICDTRMKTKDAMDKHLRTHSGHKPYVCDVEGCEKKFATCTELQTHKTVHSGKKPHVCPKCGQAFADSSNLSKHKKVHAIGRYVCLEPNCNTRMKRWDQIKRHWQSSGHMAHMLGGDKETENNYKRQMDHEFSLLSEEAKQAPVKQAASRSASLSSL